jgi:response regulator RpfG family c-di-GMP phosphodiesterase
MPLKGFQKKKLTDFDIKILIVDSEELTAKSMAQVLSNHHIFIALDEEKAYEIVEQKGPHIIIVDYDMPEKDGIEILKNIARVDKNNIRLIKSRKTNIDTILKNIEKGNIHHYIWKPIHIDSLNNIVKRCMSEYIAEYNQRMLTETIAKQNKELNKKNMKLEKLNQKKEEGIRKIAKKINAPMDVINEITQLLNQTKNLTFVEQKKYANIIRKNTDRIIDIFNKQKC